MLILSGIISLLLLIAALVGFFWMVPGTVMSIVFIVKSNKSKDLTEKARYNRLIKIGFSWIVLLFGSFILFALMKLIEVIFGIGILGIPQGA